METSRSNDLENKEESRKEEDHLECLKEVGTSLLGRNSCSIYIARQVEGQTRVTVGFSSNPVSIASRFGSRQDMMPREDRTKKGPRQY